MTDIYIYNYDFETKEYLSKQIADRDNAASEEAQEFVPLVPAYATLVKPSQTQDNQVNIFNEEQNKWIKTNDYRGQYMVNSEMMPEKITKLGDLPEGYALITEAQIALLKTKGSNYFIIVDNTLIVNPNYDKEEENYRKQDFESKFIETSWGWYRKMPNGYANAPQSIDIIDKLVTKFNGFITNIDAMMIFYAKPDFSDATQCTEEWLIAHQYHHGVCAKQEFDDFYVDFQTRWALSQYK